MIIDIEHPATFMEGTRVLMLKGRHKDGVDGQRTILRVSHNVAGFLRHHAELRAILRPGERLYASAGERDMHKAIRLFKERQLAADYDDDPQQFYRQIEARWTSCLMNPTAQARKLWLFDCDTAEHVADVKAELAQHYDRPTPPYEYATKSGRHIIVQPFDRSRLDMHVRALIHENPIMLWAYAKGKDA